MRSLYINLRVFLSGDSEKKRHNPLFSLVVGMVAGWLLNTALSVFQEINIVLVVEITCLIVFAVFVVGKYLKGRYQQSELSCRTFDEQYSSAGQLSELEQWHLCCFELGENYGLSQRENEIFELISHGRNAKHIADRLLIAESTAKSHVSNVYRKLQIHSQQEAIDMVENIFHSQNPSI